MKWHVPCAAAKEVDGPELAGRQGGQNHVVSDGRRQSYASKGWWWEGTPAGTPTWLPDPRTRPGPCRQPCEHGASGELTYPSGQRRGGDSGGGQYPRVWHLPRRLLQAVPGRFLAAASNACAGRHVPFRSPGRPVREGHRMRRE